VSAVDDLFSGEGPRPGRARPRDPVSSISLWLVAAAILDLLGVTCFTGVPGAALTIWCWHNCDEELQRVESGAAPPERAPAVRRLRGVAFALLMFSFASLALQIWLFANGFYQLALFALLSLFGAEVAPP
jgi:hypothetical protein